MDLKQNAGVQKIFTDGRVKSLLEPQELAAYKCRLEELAKRGMDPFEMLMLSKHVEKTIQENLWQ